VFVVRADEAVESVRGKGFVRRLSSVIYIFTTVEFASGFRFYNEV
jgi:hypothetical protein